MFPFQFSHSNGYTLSPIFDVGGSTDGTPKSAFHHYSLSDPDTPLGLYPLPPNDQKQSIRKSESAHVAMESKVYSNLEQTYYITYAIRNITTQTITARG